MIATKTARELNQEPSRVLRQAERETVIIEKYGEPVVAMIPYHGRGISGDELAKRLRNLKPQPEAAAALKKIIKAMGCQTLNPFPSKRSAS